MQTDPSLLRQLNPHYSPFLYRAGQIICRAIYKLFWRARIEGLERLPPVGTPMILAANHRSYVDPPLIGCFIPRPIFYFAKEELFHVPFIGWYIRRINSFPVRRGKNDVSAFKTALRVLQAKQGLVLFPEGGRRTTPERQWKAQTGVSVLAARTDAVVVPIALVNTDRLGSFSKICVRIGHPIPPPKNSEGDAHQQYADQIMARIQELMS